VPYADQVALASTLEQQAVHCDRGDQECHGGRRGHECEDVDASLERVDRGEAVHERQCEQEGEKDLHPGLRNAQFLEQLHEVAVRPLQWHLRSVLDVPRVVAHRRLEAFDYGH
jgi:hypothetical protein